MYGFIAQFTAMIILHFDLQPQFKYMNYFIYTPHHIYLMHLGQCIIAILPRRFENIYSQ